MRSNSQILESCILFPNKIDNVCIVGIEYWMFSKRQFPDCARRRNVDRQLPDCARLGSYEY